MNSMTGYGVYRDQWRGVHFEVALRSVNSRFLEVRLQGPKELSHLESWFRAEVQKHLRRGTVEIFLQRRLSPQALKVQIEPQVERAKAWLKAYGVLAQKIEMPLDMNFSQLATHSGAFVVHEDLSPRPGEEKWLQSCFRRALKDLVAERRREGRTLKKEVSGQLKALLSLLKKVEKLAEQLRPQQQKRLEERLKKLKMNFIDPQRLAQEVALVVDRADIQEEVVRLKEHVGACLHLLNATEVEGKKLEFYSQELLREMNTIGSKSLSAELTTRVVDGKSLIERIKEQVQNIE